MSIKIIKQGVLTTLQDLGRNGFRAIGVGTGGAMDLFAASVSNYLVGNDDSNTVIEINYPAAEILFEKDGVVSLAGADFTASVDDKPMPVWSPFIIRKDSVLKFKKPAAGSKVYLAVAGGWPAETWLGSSSTNLHVKAGGYLGRALCKGDELQFEATSIQMNREPSWNISQFELDKIYKPANIIRCIRSVEWELMDATSKNNFTQLQFTINNQSDRMGYRLNGEKLNLSETIELISSPVDAGTIQLLPDGNVIVLMADHQTTGGYPRIASVIKADLPKFSQLKPGMLLSFQLLEMQAAEEALISMRRLLNEIKYGCHFNFKKHFNLD